MQHDVLHRIGKEHMPVGCYAAYDVAEYILSRWPEDNILPREAQLPVVMSKNAADCECPLL